MRFVLVIEDEPILRMNAVDILEDADFAVLEAYKDIPHEGKPFKPENL